MLLNAQLMWDRVSDRSTYPYTLPAVRLMNRLDLSHPVTIIVGENGSGKSTLLEALAIALGCPAEGGSKNFRFATVDSHASLHESMRIARDTRPIKDLFFYRAETFYNFASEMRRLDEAGSFDPQIKTRYGGTELHAVSHGESVIALFRHRFRAQGVYILDEPEAALSPSRQLEVLGHIRQLTKQGAQFVLATHSPILMAFPDARIYSIGEAGIEDLKYDEVDHVRLYKRILLEGDAYISKITEES